MTSRGLCAPTYTRPNATKAARPNGIHTYSAGRSVATTAPTAATSTTWPDGKLGPEVGTSSPRRTAPGWLVPGSLADVEVGVHPPPQQPLRHQLQDRGQHHRQGEEPVAVDQGHRQADEGPDDQVAQLHRGPQRPVEPVGQAVDGPEHRALERRDLRSPRPGDRPGEDDRAGDAGDDGRVHRASVRSASDLGRRSPARATGRVPRPPTPAGRMPAGKPPARAADVPRWAAVSMRRSGQPIGVWGVTLVAAILGVVVAIWFELIELAVKEGTEVLWDQLLGTDDRRWLVVPTATVLGVAYAAVLRGLGEQRLVDEEPGILPPEPDAPDPRRPDDPDDPDGDATTGGSADGAAGANGEAREDVGRIAIQGLASLLAGASLGPEQMLVQSSGAMGTWTVRRLALTAITARALVLAAVGALMVAFLGSMVMVALPLLLAFQRLKKLPVELVLPIVVAGLTAWSTLWLVDRQTMGFGSIPSSTDVAAVDYLAAAVTGVAVALVALLLARLLRLLRRGAEHVDRTWPWWLAGAGFGLGIGLLYLWAGRPWSSPAPRAPPRWCATTPATGRGRCSGWRWSR